MKKLSFILVLTFLFISCENKDYDTTNKEWYEGKLPKWINKEYNFRDCGGWSIDNHTKVKTGKIYRGKGSIPISILKSLVIKASLSLTSIKYKDGCDALDTVLYLGNYNLNSVKRKTDEAIQFIIYNLQRDNPVIIHCDIGRDRTGKFVAALLRTLGVSSKDVNTDYHWYCNNPNDREGDMYEDCEDVLMYFQQYEYQLKQLLLIQNRSALDSATTSDMLSVLDDKATENINV